VTGLVARAIEEAGIPTIVISISLDITQKVCPPRAVVVRFPFGHALGEPGNRLQQRRVLLEAFKLLIEAKEPTINSLKELKWRRTDYAALPPVELAGGLSTR
jgi:D-proline reductase (dithiol) PrdB